MKKYISILIAACLILSLAGCGKKAEIRYHCTEVITEDLAVGDVTRTEYRYDENWNNTEMITYYNGEEISRVSYEYNGDNVTSTAIYGELTEISEIANTRDEAGNIIKTIQSIDGMVVCTTQNSYDAQGNLLRSVSDYGDGFPSITEYTYDSRGNMLTETISQEGFGVLTRREYGAEKDGTSTVRVLDAQGNLTGYYVSFFDDAGNMILQELYDATGNLTMVTICTYQGEDGTVSSGAAG